MEKRMQSVLENCLNVEISRMKLVIFEFKGRIYRMWKSLMKHSFVYLPVIVVRIFEMSGMDSNIMSSCILLDLRSRLQNEKAV